MRGTFGNELDEEFNGEPMGAPATRIPLRTHIKRVTDGFRSDVLPTMRRVRWERVIVTAGLCVVPFCLFSGTAQSHELDGLVAVDDSFIGPHVRVGYSPITNAERKAAAEEEIRQRKIANGEIDETEDEGEEESPLLDSADEQYQHEGDLDFTEACRDNLIARAIRAWRRPHWLSDIDWDEIKANVIGEAPEEQTAQPEEADSPDESIAGYDDIVRLGFTDGMGFSWSLPNGKTLSYDGTNKISGDAPVCLDLDETVPFATHSVYVLDKEADGDGQNRLTFEEGDADMYHSVSFYDKVVPDDQDGTVMMGTVGGTGLHEVVFDRRDYEIDATRTPMEGEGDDEQLTASITLLGPKGMLSDENISARVSSPTNHLKIRASCVGITLWTDDESGLAGTEVKLRYRYRGQDGTAEQTLDTTDQYMFIDLEDYRSE